VVYFPLIYPFKYKIIATSSSGLMTQSPFWIIYSPLWIIQIAFLKWHATMIYFWFFQWTVVALHEGKSQSDDIFVTSIKK